MAEDGDVNKSLTQMSPGQRARIDRVNSLQTFVLKSNEFLEAMYALARVKAKPFPRRADPAKRNRWAVEHPNLRPGTPFADGGLLRIAKSWYAAYDAAYAAAGDDATRTVIVAVGSVVPIQPTIEVEEKLDEKGQQRVAKYLDATNEQGILHFARDHFGIYLRKFEAKLLHAERHLSYLFVTLTGGEATRLSLLPPPPTLHPDALAVVRVLGKAPSRMMRDKLAGLDGLPRDVKTIGVRVNELIGFGLAERNSGKKGGVAITAAGRKYLADHPA